MKKKQFRKNQKFGNWTLQSYLGGGGNGEVWQCFDKDNNIGAVKLLKSVNSKSYSRFLDETNVIESNSDIIGIMPMIDKYLPKALKGNIPFFVMPVAKSAEEYLKGKSIEKKIDSILEICETLRELHKRGISHRDIKPPNFLVYNSRCIIADFGLVDYPNKKDVSFTNEVIGAKWTMAPEMRRESSKADGLKADIYSLAKTLWIILTESPKGFDGQYSAKSILELNQFCKGAYTTPIDTLLSQSTDNNPNSRPNIDEFIEALKNWKELNEHYHERNLAQWLEIQETLFPTAFPKRVIWEDINDIINVLKVVCKYDDLNHLFFPNGGGSDLEDIRLANEKGCIELDFQSIHIIKPKRLIFESFGYEPGWNYFRIELNILEPAGVYEEDTDEADVNQDPYDDKHFNEDVSELYPGQYDKYDIIENRYDYQDSEDEIPESARHVTRWFKGNFVIFSKTSAYNSDSSTYDGRHNKMDTDEFRGYIQRSVDKFRIKDKKKSTLDNILDKMKIIEKRNNW